MTKSIFHFLFSIVFALGCKQANTTSDLESNSGLAINSSGTDAQEPIIVERHSYKESLSVVGFFNQLVKNHMDDFNKKYPNAYADFLTEHQLPNDTFNKGLFFKLLILHKLFTSQGAYNGAQGEILNIPYFWHWVTPNPRHSIQSLQHGIPLNKVKPPRAFGRYNSFADIDRTPALFLREWFSPSPLYSTLQNDTFNTFGWCSEREMSFVCLLEIMGLKGKVVAKGNHSWTELLVNIVDNKGEAKVLIATVDNTFDEMSFEEKEDLDTTKWYADVGEHRLQKWYNQKARSIKEKTEVKNIKGSKAVYSSIELSVVDFLNKR